MHSELMSGLRSTDIMSVDSKPDMSSHGPSIPCYVRYSDLYTLITWQYVLQCYKLRLRPKYLLMKNCTYVLSCNNCIKVQQSKTVKLEAGHSIESTEYNSRRLLDHLQYVFALCDPVTLTFNLLT